MADTVKVTDGDFYGEIEKSPDFAPEIKVKFALDVPASSRRKYKELLTKGESDDSAKEIGEYMLKMMVKDWNLVDEKDEKLPITTNSFDNYLSARLSGWILGCALNFFKEMSTTTNP